MFKTAVNVTTSINAIFIIISINVKLECKIILVKNFMGKFRNAKIHKQV